MLRIFGNLDLWQRLVKKTGRQVRLEILLNYVQCTKKNFVQREKRVTVEENKTKTHLKRKEKIKDDANIKESGSLTRTASKTNREILFADRCSAKSAIARHCTVETTKAQFSALHRLVVDIVTALLSSSLHCTGYWQSFLGPVPNLGVLR